MNKILFKLIEGKGKFFLIKYPYIPLSEALKNGEIMNPEVLPITFYHNSALGLGRLSHNETHVPIDDGDTFDLPEGMGFEETQYNFKSAVCLLPEKPVQKEYVINQPTELGVIGTHFGAVQKEESQEELMDDLLSQYFTMIKNGASMFTASNNLQSKFTIKRKES